MRRAEVAPTERKTVITVIKTFSERKGEKRKRGLKKGGNTEKHEEIARGLG